MEKPTFTKEEELAILEEGKKTQFYQVLSIWLSHQAFTTAGSALSQNVPNREWMAGRASAYKEVFNRVADRTRELKRYIEEQKKQNT